MANKQISQLPAASELQNNDLLVAEQNGVAKSVTGTVLLAMLDGHGGIASTSYTPPVAPSLQGTLTLTFADGTTASVPIYNGAQGATGSQGVQGEKGDPFTYEDFTTEQIESLRGPQGIQGETGNPGYCHIKWAAVEPTSDADMSDIPGAWMGIYSGSSSTAPTAYTAYAWYEIKGDTGADGEDGERGSWIWKTGVEPTAYGENWRIGWQYVEHPLKSTDSPKAGDLLFYGNTYFVFTGQVVSGNLYVVTSPNTINSAALPEYGNINQVLVKQSNESFDVAWADLPDVEELYRVTYRGIDTNDTYAAFSNNKLVYMDYQSRFYTLTYVSGAGAHLVFTAVTGNRVYVMDYTDGAWVTADYPLGGGSSDYTDLSNKPSINSVTLSGNKTAADLSLASAADVAAKEDKVTEVTVSAAGAVTQALDAGKIYHFTGALTALTITLNAAASGQLTHYHFDFNCGSTAVTLNVPASVVSPDGWSTDINKHYEIDILNDYAVAAEWGIST